jgi:hypothetical protein
MPPDSRPDSREWAVRVELALENAEAGRSEVVPTVLSIPGMTSPRVKHFLNNLCRARDVVYLEIGSWQGATITAASCNNPGRFVAIENFVHGGGGQFHANRRATSAWCRFEFLERDCWQVPPREIAEPGQVNVFFYDGPHDFASQLRAFTQFDRLFARDFVAVVDDWDHPPVRKGTRVGFDALRYEVLREWELPARFNGDKETWWNGLYVALARKDLGHSV